VRSDQVGQRIIREDEEMSEPDILYNWGDWIKTLLRDNIQCVYCGLDGKQDMRNFRQLVAVGIARDHLVPRSADRDRRHELDNLVICCWPCNRMKMDYDPRDTRPDGTPDPDTPRQRMIEKVRARLQQDFDYFEKARKALLALLPS
jgi:hypothetical protein